MSLHPIHHIFLLGERPGRGVPMVLPPNELVNSPLLTLGFLPQTMEQLVMGYKCYLSLLRTGEHCGYSTIFVYNDSLQHFLSTDFIVNWNSPIVYHIVTSDIRELDMISEMLRKVHSDTAFYMVDDFQKAWFKFGGAIKNTDELLTQLYKLAPQFVDFSKISEPYAVPDAGVMLDRGMAFNPTRVNTLIGQSMIGNWGFEVEEISKEDKAKESANAMANEESFERQNQIIHQIRILNSIENSALVFAGITKQIDRRKAPLILVIPFTSSDHRRQLKDIKIEGYDSQKAALDYVLSQSTSQNYTVSGKIEVGSKLTQEAIGSSFIFVFGRRASLLDGMALLHSSLRYSPCLRLPFLGVEINRELSFVAPKESEYVVNANLADITSKSIEKVILNIGRKIAERALSSQACEMLEKSRRQIVAISDLPAEWITVNGIPLGFTHDICRIPEVPNSSVMMHYVITQAQRYVVPRDIIHKTLVIYGSSEDVFLPYQEKCEELKARLGFCTSRCGNKDDFFKAVHHFRPEFLLLDTHGGYDEENHQTYIMMGSDRIYPQDLVDNKVSVPLVFISACNTAPTYNATNTIANGLFEAGSIAVTSAYLPLEINKSSTTYLRLLNSLAYASQHPMHNNWLSFISHILRTSFIHDAFENYYANSEKPIEQIANSAPTFYTAKSMIFEKRRELYKELQSGIEIEGHKVNYNNKIPHYLMYSTLGRADLIRFQSYIEDVIIKEVEEMKAASSPHS